MHTTHILTPTGASHNYDIYSNSKEYYVYIYSMKDEVVEK